MLLVSYRYDEYLKWADSCEDDDHKQKQPKMSSFVKVGDPVYGINHPRQLAINNSIIHDLIIKCSLPLSIVENNDFRHFLHVVEPKVHTHSSYHNYQFQIATTTQSLYYM